MGDHQKLLSEVYDCQRCGPQLGFTRPAPNAPYYKFPPTIGALGTAPLLFVGINPRISPDNQDLHDRIMGDMDEFAKLADNVDEQPAYITALCKETHYHAHIEIVQKMFGAHARFEDYAAVTELFFCAKRSATGLDIEHSPCADIFFKRVFLKVRPVIVFCVWRSVMSYFQRIARVGAKRNFLLTLGGHTALVVDMPK